MPGTDLRICGLIFRFRFLFDISARIVSWSPQFRAVRLASRPELRMVPEEGIEPSRGYPQGILSPFITIKYTTRHNSRQHATTLKPPCRRGLGAPSAVGRCCGELPDVGSKCPMSVPWVIRPLPFVRNPIDPASIQTPRVSTRQCRSSNPRKSQPMWAAHGWLCCLRRASAS